MYFLDGLSCFSFSYREFRRCLEICSYKVPIWDMPAQPKITRISKKIIKMINSKARTVKRLQRARESHRKPFEESEDEE